ncbi:MAG TPA: glycogen debranching enzyme N-terminal domain-containing protein [Anaerolineae bacterium]|nr:glycogen debranching enzyme N-terminal domain-containing protein [Anaerolineae bacterium]
MVVIPREICRIAESALAHEWQVSNRHGSYAAATIAGALTRRSHGLLVAELKPHGRTVMLAKLDEEIEVEGHLYKFGTNEYQPNIISPDGFLYLQQVVLDGNLTRFDYQVGGVELTKTIWMDPDHSTTYIRYTLAEHSSPVQLTLLPLCDYRSTENLTHGSESWHFQIESEPSGFRVTAYAGAMPYRILTQPTAEFIPLDLWYWRFQLRADEHQVTDLYVPGLVRTTLAPGASLTVIATCEIGELAAFHPDRALERAATLSNSTSS